MPNEDLYLAMLREREAYWRREIGDAAWANALEFWRQRLAEEEQRATERQGTADEPGVRPGGGSERAATDAGAGPASAGDPGARAAGTTVWQVTRYWYVVAERATEALERTVGKQHTMTDVKAIAPRPGLHVIGQEE